MATADSQLLVRATGEAFGAARYDLRSVDLVVANYRILLDQTIPFAIGQARLTNRAKEQITYEVEFRHGSLELLSTIALAAAPVIAAMSSDGGFQIAYQVAKLFNSVITFRRAWANLQTLLDERQGNGKLPKVNLSINIEGVSQGNGNTINVNPLVLLASSASRHTVDRLVAGVDGRKVEAISFDGGDGSKTLLTKKDQVLLGTDLEELPTTVDILGKLYEVNFNTKRGWLVTGEGRIPVTWEESARRDIKMFADEPNAAFRVRPIVDRRRFSFDNSPVGYHVLKVWVPQGSLLAPPPSTCGPRQGRKVIFHRSLAKRLSCSGNEWFNCTIPLGGERVPIVHCGLRSGYGLEVPKLVPLECCDLLLRGFHPWDSPAVLSLGFSLPK